LYVKYGDVYVIFVIVPLNPLLLKSVIVVPLPGYEDELDGSKYNTKLLNTTFVIGIFGVILNPF
jgi:hypothetical protein